TGSGAGRCAGARRAAYCRGRRASSNRIGAGSRRRNAGQREINQAKKRETRRHEVKTKTKACKSAKSREQTILNITWLRPFFATFPAVLCDLCVYASLWTEPD